MEQKNELYKWKDNFAEIVLSKNAQNFTELRIDGGLQFMERDEHRYHQAVFMLPSLFVKKEKIKVLILGGGDGLGARELMFLPFVESIDLVDISDSMIFMSSSHPEMAKLNNNSLNNPKVSVNIMDSNIFIDKAIENSETWDLIILDYPDPSVFNDSPINNLFSSNHYAKVSKILSNEGIVSIQATSVYISPNIYEKVFLNIAKTTSSQLKLLINIQSFGDIGVILARKYTDDNQHWSPYHQIPPKSFFDEQSINKFTIMLKDEMPTLTSEIIEQMSIPDLIKYDISADNKRIENNFFTNHNVHSLNRLLDMSEEKALELYNKSLLVKCKTAKEIFVNNEYLLGYPNSGYNRLKEDDVFFQNLNLIKDNDGYINSVLKVRVDEDYIESEFIYTNNINNSLAMYRLYAQYLVDNNFKPLMLTYWSHNPLTQKVVEKLGGEIIDKGFTWNIQIPNVNVDDKPTEDMQEDLGELGYFSYNGLFGSWETNWVETKHRVKEIISYCALRNIPNLAIFSQTPPVEYDYFLYKTAKIEFNKENPKMSKTLRRMMNKMIK